MLYPIDSETREVRDLGGLWEFTLDPHDRGLAEAWFAKTEWPGPVVAMPVPASYNDISTDPEVRDHVGPVWYRRGFYAPEAWRNREVRVRVGAASHRGTVWVNGRQICTHKGGFLPFEGEAGEVLNYGEAGLNTVVVRVDNVLDWTTLPPGVVSLGAGASPTEEGIRQQDYFHDFFNYSGLHRPVRLVVTPPGGIRDVTVRTEIQGRSAMVGVHIDTPAPACVLTLLDAVGRTVATAEGIDAVLEVGSPQLWYPGKPYLYELKIEAREADGGLRDCYRLPVGIRTVRVEGDSFLVNGRPFYFRGFGKHEDSDIRGKGQDDVVNQRDFNLLKWIHANSFRTSHYPYAEEILRMADREGVAIIGECPAVGIYLFEEQENPTTKLFVPEKAGDELRQHHFDCMREMIARDKNHACILMWSLGNETATHEEAAYVHFHQLTGRTRQWDPTRPLTIVECNYPWHSKIGGLVDVISFNRYYGWYSDTARLETIAVKLRQEIEGWRQRWPKPLFIAEYGADTIAGLHKLPAAAFSEEFQVEYLDAFHAVFDEFPFIVGEHVWSFADFATKQGITRIDGNRKGVFTRQRQPKAAAHYLRQRWRSMAAEETASRASAEATAPLRPYPAVVPDPLSP